MTEHTPGSDSEQIVERSDSDTEVEISPRPTARQNWLKSRVDRWRQSGLITDEQSQAILDFESVGTPKFRLGIRFNRLIVVLSTLGAVLIASGIISFVAANWQGMPAMAKLFLLIVGQTAAYWIGYQLQFVRGYPRVGEAIMFTGAVWFGANVFLVAQSYHLGTDNPDLMILWFLGVLPLAYLARSTSITVMAVGIFTVGISWKAATWVDGPESAFLVMGSLFLTAALLYSIGMLHLRRANLKLHAGPYLISGALLAIGLAYVLTFNEVFEDTLSLTILDFQTLSGSYLALAGILSAVTVAALVVAVRNSDNNAVNPVGRYAELGVVALVIAFGWFTATLPFNSIALYVTAFNLLLVLLIFGSIVLGIINRREALINVGIIFFVIDLSTRYIELTVDMLDTSLAFVVGGLLLLGVGYGMERARRQLLRQFGITRDHGTEANNDA
jgi:uncharacterized membrane protein